MRMKRPQTQLPTDSLGMNALERAVGDTHIDVPRLHGLGRVRAHRGLGGVRDLCGLPFGEFALARRLGYGLQLLASFAEMLRRK